MSVLQQLFVLAAVVLPCQPFPDHPPTTTCQFLKPKHNKHETQPLSTSPYSIVVSNYSYSPGQELQVNIIASQPQKGFMIQARAEGDLNPVGQFFGDLDDGTTFIWCSGGQAKNSIGHSKAKVFHNMTFRWRAPELSVGDIRFWSTVVRNFSVFWVGLKSDLVTTSLPTVTQPPVTLEEDFTITKEGCGTNKSCYSEPPQCSSSNNCQFLVTFKKNGENLLFEMSTDLGYASVGFNNRKEMNDTEGVSCSKLANNKVVVRHYWMDYHQPIRTDISNSSDVVYDTGVYTDGIVKCRFIRKIKPAASVMRDLSLKKWYYIFAWSHVYHETGGLHYHYENASYTAKHVDITTPTILENGRRAASAEVTKEDCGKGKGCWSDPPSCTSSSNCRYLLKYKPVGESVDFEITGKASWVSIGFNDKIKMDGTEAIICVKETSGALLEVDHYTIKGYDPPKRSTPRPAGLRPTYEIYENSIVSCRFELKREAPGIRNLNEKVHLIFASGPISGDGQIMKHTMKRFTTKPIKLTDIQVLEAASEVLLQYHGILMSVAWLGLASIGMFMARYMKQVWETDLCGKKTWFQVHRSLMFLSVITTIAGFVLVFIHVGGWSEGAGVHSYIGVVVTALAVIQPIMAFFRPHPGTPKRVVFNWAHKVVGAVTLILAIVNSVVGVMLDSMGIARLGWVAFVPYGVAFLVVFIFEIFIFVKRNSNWYPVAKTDLKDDDVKITPPPQPKLSPGEKELYRWIFGGLIVLTVSAVVVVSVFIVLKPGEADEV